MHNNVRQFTEQVKGKYPEYFKGTKVFEGGSVNINGTVRAYFDDTKEYIGVDVNEGPDVDIAIGAHEYDKEDGYFDVVTSVNHLEHDMFWEKSIDNMYRMLRSGGLYFFSCASGWYEHGTDEHAPNDSLTTTIGNDEWAKYYRNLFVKDIEEHWDLENMFSEYKLEVVGPDLMFYGIKK